MRDSTLVSAKATSATASEPPSTGSRSAQVIHGSDADGNPCGSVPSTLTPCCRCRSKSATALVAAMMAISMPGTRGQRFSSRISASEPAPTPKAAPLKRPLHSACTKATACAGGPSPEMEMPHNLGSWLTMTANAMPFM